MVAIRSKLDPQEELDDAVTEMKRLGSDSEFPEEERPTGNTNVHVHVAKEGSDRPKRKPEQSRIVQLTTLVTAIGAIITSIVVAFKPDNSKDLVAYEKMREVYEAVRKDAIRQNGDNAVTRSEVVRVDDEKTQQLEAMKQELAALRVKARLPEAGTPPPAPTPKPSPVASVTLPRSLDDVPQLPKR